MGVMPRFLFLFYRMRELTPSAGCTTLTATLNLIGEIQADHRNKKGAPKRSSPDVHSAQRLRVSAAAGSGQILGRDGGAIGGGIATTPAMDVLATVCGAHQSGGSVNHRRDGQNVGAGR